MLEAFALFRQRIEFGDPLALFVVPLALTCLLLGLVIWVLMRRIRPLRTHGSSYPRIGPLKLWLAASIVLAIVGLAAAQPRFRYGGSSFKRGTVDVPILIDVSASMWVTDLGMSRLEVATRELTNLQTEGILQTGDRLALFVFGGTTIRKSHLSPKVDRVMEQIRALRPPPTLGGDTFPWDSDIAGAFEHVYQSLDLQDRFEAGEDEQDFRPARRSDRVVILLTDGDIVVERDKVQRVDAALAEFRRRGISVYPIGIGTRTGEDLISILRRYQPQDYDPSLPAELEGQRTALRTTTLSYLADRTGGKAFTLENTGQSAVTFLREAIGSHRGLSVQLVPSQDNLDAWQYLVVGALVLLAVAILFY